MTVLLMVLLGHGRSRTMGARTSEVFGGVARGVVDLRLPFISLLS